MNNKSIFSLLLLLASTICAGQRYIVTSKHWSIADGLSSRQVNHVFQDNRGFIWCATPNGLNRFDGINFVLYDKNNTDIPFRTVSNIKRQDTATGELLLEEWEGARYTWFNPLNKKVRYPVDFLGGSDYLNCDTLSENREFNVNRYVIAFGKSQRHYRYVGGKLLPMPFLDSLEQGGEMTDGSFIAFSKRNWPPFYCYNFSPDGSCQHRVLLPGKVLDASLYDAVRGSILGIGDSIFLLDTAFILKKCFDSKSRIINHHTLHTQIDKYYLFDNKIIGIDGSTPDGMSSRDSWMARIPTRSVLLIGRGRMIIGNDNGLYQLVLSENHFKKYQCDVLGAAARNAIRGITIVGNRLITCNQFKGVNFSVLNNSHEAVPKMIEFGASHFGDGYYAILNTGSSLLFSLGGCLFQVPNKGKHTARCLNLKNPAPNIWAIGKVKDSLLILGTENGLRWAQWSGSSLNVLPERPNLDLHGMFILSVTEVENGYFWICTDKGLIRYRRDSGAVATYNESGKGLYHLPATNIRHFWKGKDGTFWLASDEGLIRWEQQNGRYRLFTRLDGLSNNNLYAVYGDRYGYLWFSSDNGIMRMEASTGHITTFLEEDGISNNEFNRIAHFQDSSGVIYFGSLNGVTAFDPKDFLNDLSQPGAPLALSSFQQFDGASNKLVDRYEQVVKTNQVNLQPSDRFFNMEFALLNYLSPENTVYFWKIDGLDTGWTSQKEKVLRFGRLPYGNWVLRVKAQGANGVWGKNELAMVIHVHKPVYLQTWFIILSILITILLIVALISWRLRDLRRLNIRQEEIIMQRTNDLTQSLEQKDELLSQKVILLKEIHHRVKNNLQVISALLDLQNTTLKDENVRSAITESTTRVKAISLIHQQLYQSEDITAIEIGTFITELFRQISVVFSSSQKYVQLDNQTPVITLDVDTAVPLGLILNELMTNSFKYAFEKETRGTVSTTIVRLTEHDFELQYTDSGPGLPPGFRIKDAKSLGLQMIGGLARQLSGSLEYDPEKNMYSVSFKDLVGRKSID